jgi:hypothetical protein
VPEPTRRVDDSKLFPLALAHLRCAGTVDARTAALGVHRARLDDAGLSTADVVRSTVGRRATCLGRAVPIRETTEPARWPRRNTIGLTRALRPALRYAAKRRVDTGAVQPRISAAHAPADTVRPGIGTIAVGLAGVLNSDGTSPESSRVTVGEFVGDAALRVRMAGLAGAPAGARTARRQTDGCH